MDAQKTKNRDELLWLIMVFGLIVGGLLTFFGLTTESTPATVFGIILLAFGGVAMFMKLGRR